MHSVFRFSINNASGEQLSFFGLITDNSGCVWCLQVREKFAAGKLKDITLPRLKQFISSHKLGKVGGKKEVLMATVEAFLGRKEP